MKVFGKAAASPEKKILGGKLLKKSVTTDEKNLLRSFGESPSKASPLKRQMRLFEAPDSPQKNVADLNKVSLKPSVFSNQPDMNAAQHILKHVKNLKP